MLADKNEIIKTAYEILERVSKSKVARMAYDARQAEIVDQLTSEKSAEKGILTILLILEVFQMLNHWRSHKEYQSYLLEKILPFFEAGKDNVLQYEMIRKALIKKGLNHIMDQSFIYE